MSNLRLPSAPPGWLVELTSAQAERDELAAMLAALVEALPLPGVLHPGLAAELLGLVPAARRDAVVVGMRQRELVDASFAREWFGRFERAET